MGAGHDQERQQRADDGGSQPGGDGAQAVDGRSQDVGDDVADGAQHAQGGDAHHEHGEEGRGEEADGLGGDAGGHRLYLGHQQHAQQDGDDRRGIGGIVDGQPENGDGHAAFLGGRYHTDKVGVDQDAAQHHGQVGVAAQLFGCGIGQQDGQEVEGGIRHEVDHLVGAGITADQLEGHQDRQDRFQHTGGGQRRQDGGKDTGDGVDQTADHRSLLLLGGGCGRTHVPQFGGQLLIYLGDLRSDDDLVLPVGRGHAQNARGALDGIGVGLALVLQVEAQTGGAVGHIGDVALSAHQTDDLFGKLIVVFFFSHV